MLSTLLVMQAVIGYGRVAAAGDQATSAAQTAALWAARSGDASEAAALAHRLVPDAEVDAWRDGESIHVVVRRSVSVVGPASGPVRHTVVGRGAASVAPYRSGG